MASYKVLQDVEAEDKLVGPLSFRQFVYAGIAAICLYLCYFVIAKGAAFLALIFLPVAIVCAFFAFPWGRDQPTEVWALAKIRFLLKPRRRIWDQSGVKELVTITAPKKIETNYTNGLSQNEVTSRLHALADTLDSRGWAIKNMGISTAPALVIQAPGNDRLLDATAFTSQALVSDVGAADDMLDEQNNPSARRVDTMIEQASRTHRQQLIDSLNKPATEPQKQAPAPNNYWFLDQPSIPSSIPNNMVTFSTQVVSPGMAPSSTPIAGTATDITSVDETTLAKTLQAKQRELPHTAYYSHLHTIQPLSAQRQSPAANSINPAAPSQSAPTLAMASPPPTPPSYPQPITAPPVTPAQQADILRLSGNNDLNVATIAREVNRNQNEVVIKLH